MIYTYVYKYVGVYEYMTPYVYGACMGHINIILPHPRITYVATHTVYLYLQSRIEPFWHKYYIHTWLKPFTFKIKL